LPIFHLRPGQLQALRTRHQSGCGVGRLPAAVVADADIAGTTGAYRVLQRRKRFVDRGAVIPYVDLPQIQMVDSQELQRGIKLIEQTAARGVTDDAVGTLPEPRLGCQYDPFAQPGFCQQRPDQRLSSAAAVDRSGIDQGSRSEERRVGREWRSC